MTNDICRCHDDGCSEREQCLRWLLRDDYSGEAPHMPSLFPYDLPIGDPCPRQIKP
jgi:hypothetical protein